MEKKLIDPRETKDEANAKLMAASKQMAIALQELMACHNKPSIEQTERQQYAFAKAEEALKAAGL